MEIFNTKDSVRKAVRGWQAQGFKVGFVPTMGALHDGHQSLMKTAREHNDRWLVSIYVNPTQFDRKDDLDSYPNDLETDKAKLRSLACDGLFSIADKDMYPEEFSTWVVPEGDLVQGLCGRSRGSHFRGVTTIVSKLFNIVRADRAYFGQKDYQQFAIIKRMVRDLDIPIEVLSCPTVRESDGLALSSRNQLLTEENRQKAIAVPRSLFEAIKGYKSGQKNGAVILNQMRARLELSGARVDYLEAVDSVNLSPKPQLDDRTVIALAAFFGDVRLIDNHVLGQNFPVCFS
jgi:pantoate--beta-alanine ligase